MRAQPCLLTTLFAAVVVAYNLLTCTCAVPRCQWSTHHHVMRAQPCLLTTLFAAVVVAYNLLTCACAIPLLSMAYSSPRDARAAVPADDAVCGGGGGEHLVRGTKKTHGCVRSRAC